MIKVVLPDSDRTKLQDLHQNHIHPVIQKRSLVILLRSENISNSQITHITGLNEKTITSYAYLYSIKGMDWLTGLNFRKPESQLKPFDEMIKEYFDKNAVATIKEACKVIFDLTGVTLKETQVRNYLKKLDIKYRKVSSIPSKADLDAQQEFHDNLLQPKLEEAKAGKRAVYFVDAAHFVFGAFLGYLWSLTRVFVRTPSGRQRFNVLGALNAISKELTTITNFSYITSIQVCELLKKLKDSTTLPITIVLDNARYQRCHLVMELAKELGIELLFLPAYSPNLNLIERLWKFTKKHCLNSKYYSNFPLFHEAINTFLGTMHQSHHKELQTLLALNFQLFDKDQVAKAI